jgi:hypothetical protein
LTTSPGHRDLVLFSGSAEPFIATLSLSFGPSLVDLFVIIADGSCRGSRSDDCFIIGITTIFHFLILVVNHISFLIAHSSRDSLCAACFLQHLSDSG